MLGRSSIGCTIPEASGGIQQHASLDEILCLEGVAGGGVEGRKASETVSRQHRRLLNDVLHKIHRLVSPNFRRIVYCFQQRLVAPTKAQQVHGKHVVVPRQDRNVAPPVVDAGPKPVYQQQGWFVWIAHFHVVDVVLIVLIFLPLVCLVALPQQRQSMVGEGIKVGQNSTTRRRFRSSAGGGSDGAERLDSMVARNAKQQRQEAKESHGVDYRI